MSGPVVRIAANGAVIVSLVLLLSDGVSTATTTNPPKAPGVGTGSVLEVNGTVVVLQGWVEPRGQETDFHYELGKTTSYGISPELNDEHAVRGYGRVRVLEAIPGLQPRTTYHFRLVAHNRAGTRYGKDKTFRTRSKRADGRPGQYGAHRRDAAQPRASRHCRSSRSSPRS